MNSIWDKNLRELRDSTASDKPVATAGAVSTVTAVLGYSLLIMTLEIQITKLNDQRRKRKASLLLEDFRKRMAHMASFADQDISAFKNFIEAFTLKDNTRSQREIRVSSIRDNRLSVISVPLLAAMAILESYPGVEKMIDIVSGTLLADIATGTELLTAALHSLLWTVQVNTRDLDEKEMKRIQRERKRIARSANEFSEKILDRLKALI